MQKQTAAKAGRNAVQIGVQRSRARRGGGGRPEIRDGKSWWRGFGWPPEVPPPSRFGGRGLRDAGGRAVGVSPGQGPRPEAPLRSSARRRAPSAVFIVGSFGAARPLPAPRNPAPGRRPRQSHAYANMEMRGPPPAASPGPGGLPLTATPGPGLDGVGGGERPWLGRMRRENPRERDAEAGREARDGDPGRE